jgi:serine/threonine protein phosphatase PrpC
MRDENEYTIKQCSCVKEYSLKKYHNEPYHIALTCQLFAMDRFDTKITDGFFGIFDGINGDEVAIYLRQNLPNLFQRMIHFNPKRIFPYHPPNTKLDKKIKGIETSIETIFLNLFLKLDEDIKIMKCLDVGATACVVFLTEEEDELTGYKKKNKVIYCAFIGDVNCIVISKTKARKLTKNHTIEDKDERKRIENIGGVIYDEKIYGQENLTRAFGMFNLKQYGITCIPETVKITLNPLDRYVIIGTKGVFESLTDGDLLNLCNNTESTDTIIKNIVQNCINRFTRENLGIIAIKL